MRSGRRDSGVRGGPSVTLCPYLTKSALSAMTWSCLRNFVYLGRATGWLVFDPRAQCMTCSRRREEYDGLTPLRRCSM